MSSELYFEDVNEGQELPLLRKQPDARQLVMWAGASEDFNLVHFDRDYALKIGLQDVIVHGPLRIAFLGQLITNWIGDNGRIEFFCSRMLEIVAVNTPLVCKGKVVKKYRKGNKNLIECELWIQDQLGKINTAGKAIVSLPLKSGNML